MPQSMRVPAYCMRALLCCVECLEKNTHTHSHTMLRSSRGRGLLYCMEYLEENLHEWLGEELQVCVVVCMHASCMRV